MVKVCIGGNQALGTINFTNTGKPVHSFAHMLLMRLEFHENIFSEFMFMLQRHSLDNKNNSC